MEYTYYIYSLKLVLYCLHFHKMKFQGSNCLDKSFHLSHKLDHTQQTFVFMKTSWKRLQDVLIKTNMFAVALRLQKTSSRRLPDVLVKTNIFALAICLQDVFKTSSRHLQDVLKTSSRCLQDIFKTSCKDIFKTFSRRTIKLICST